jgi:hypothetical protein
LARGPPQLEKEVEGYSDYDEQESKDQRLILSPPDLPPFAHLLAQSGWFSGLGGLAHEFSVLVQVLPKRLFEAIVVRGHALARRSLGCEGVRSWMLGR